MAQTLRVTVVGDVGGYQAALAKASAATAGFGRSMVGAGRSIQRTGRTLTTHVSLPLAAIGVASVKMADEFETSMSRVTGLAGVSQKQTEEWGQTLIRLGPQVGKTPRELAEALYFVASSGVSTAHAMDVVTASARASEAGLGDTQTVADALTSVMNAYGESNMTAAQAADTLVATVREGKGEASDFAPIIGNVVAVASKMGVSFNDVGAALAGMTRLGTDAATAGTQLQAFFASLLKTAPKAEEQLKAVGLSSAGLRQELREKGLLATLQTLQDRFHGNISAMAKAFPNLRGMRTLMALLGESTDSTEAIFKRMGNTTGSLAKAFDAARKTSGFKFDQLKASAEAAGISLGMILMPSVTKVTDALAKLAIAYTNLSPQMKNWIAIAGAVAIVAGPMLMITGSLVRAVGSLLPVITALLSPLGLLAVAIGVVVGAFVAAELAPEQFAAALEKLGLSAQQAQSVVTTLQGIFDQVKTAVQDVVAAIQTIWATLGSSLSAQTSATWNYITSQLRGVLNIIRGIFNVFAGLLSGDWSRVWQGIQQIASGIWTNISSQFRFFANLLINTLRAAGAVLSRLLTPVWNAIKSAMSAAWNAIVSATRGAWNAVVGAIRGAIGRATSAAGAVGRGIVSGITRGLATIVAAVRGKFQDVWDFVKGAAGSAYAFAFGVGAALMRGVAAGIESLIGWAVGKAKSAVNAIKTGFGLWGSTSFDWAKTVGEGLPKGVAAGIAASLPEATTAAEKAKNAIKARLVAGDMLAAIRAAGQKIGLEHARAIAAGMFQGQPTLVQQYRQRVAEWTAAAQQKLTESKAAFVSAFQQLAQSALAAFDAKMAAWTPPSQRILDKMQLADQMKSAADAIAAAWSTVEGMGAAKAAELGATLGPQLDQAMSGAMSQIAGAKTLAALDRVSVQAQAAMTRAITAATAPATQAAQQAVDQAAAALAAAQAGGDPEAVAAAQQAYDTAVANQKALEAAIQSEIETATGRLVTAEQTRHDQLAAKQREGLARQLSDLETNLLEHPKKWNTMAMAVQRILAGYNVKLVQAGHAWASKFGDGIIDGIPEAVTAARQLAAAVAAVLPSTSSPLKPAKTGPLDFHPFDMGQAWMQNMKAGFTSGGGPLRLPVEVRAPAPALAGAGTMTPVGGGGLTIEFHGAFYGGSPDQIARDIADPVYRELLRRNGRNATMGFR